MKSRDKFIERIGTGFRTHPVVVLLGPRQCGKTTLAHLFTADQKEVHFFDLEDPVDLVALESPVSTLESLEGLIVLDEIQRVPELFSILRVLVDRGKGKRQFLILGSASRDLLRQSSETLAGRIAYIELTPFSLDEVEDRDRLWIRGGFPNSYLAKSDQDSSYWREQYIRTFLERDIPNLGIRIAPQALRRFWMMLAHYHGQTLNASELGRSFGVADTTIRDYLDILTGTFMMRQLSPWLANIKKRQVKRPKIYFRDSGLLHSLCNITNHEALMHNPLLGASWEGFALEQTIRRLGASSEECFYWGVHGMAELDLLIFKDGKRLGFEFKYNDAPRATSSMHHAVELLELDSLTVVYPGSKAYAISPKIMATPMR